MSDQTALDVSREAVVQLLDERNAALIKLGALSAQMTQAMKSLDDAQREIVNLKSALKAADAIAKMRGEELVKKNKLVAEMDATVRTCLRIAGDIVGGALERPGG